MQARTIFTLILLAVLGCAEATPSATLGCNIHGLTTDERRESQALLQKLGGAVVELKELSDGYAFRLDESKMPLRELSRWIELERRCCPFFHFETEVAAERGPVWLRLTGGEGVKDFIATKINS